MKKSIIMMVISIIFVGLSCSKEAKQDVLKIHSFFGSVKIESQGISNVPEVGQILSLNDVIITGNDAIVDVVYRDAGIIRIHENTKVLVQSLIKDAADAVVLTIETGKTFATLSKLKKGDSFALQSKTVIAAVRGTSFRMIADEKGAQVNVVTGRVMVKPVSNQTVIEDVEVVVEENQTVALDTKTVETIVQKIEEKKTETTEKDQQQKIVEEIKEKIKPVETPEETIKEIKEEVKDVVIVAVVNEQVKQEISKVVEDDTVATKKEEEEKLRKEQAQKAMQLELEKKHQAKMVAEKLEKERLAKEKEQREKAAKEQKIKEGRVKNIPTL